MRGPVGRTHVTWRIGPKERKRERQGGEPQFEGIKEVWKKSERIVSECCGSHWADAEPCAED